MARVFVSYSRKNKDFCRLLTDELQKRELDFWVDWDGIPPTVDWMKEIEKGIEEADTFIAIVSPDWIASPICVEELGIAVKNGKRLIPVVPCDIVWNTVPAALSHLNFIFFTEAFDFNKQITTLFTALDTDYDWLKTHRRLQVKALEWERSNKEGGFLLHGRDLEEAEQQISVNATKNPNPTDLQREYVLKSRQETDKQRRLTMGGLILIIVFLVGLTAWIGTPLLLNSMKRSQAQSLEPMVSIPAGQVKIGTDTSDGKEAYYPEGPSWTTNLNAFKIDKYEVSNRLYRLCVDFGDCTPPVRSADYNNEQKVNHPVVYVTVIQAATYCNWVGRRLPTEIEWERAARGPIDQDRAWPWGNEPVDDKRANMANQSYTPTGTLPVNNLPDGATSDGIFNLVGNVWEWTSSYAPDISSNAAYTTQTAWDGKAKAFDKDMSFVQRGGGWNNSIERITSRYYVGDRDGYQDAGFRCAVD